MLKKMLRQAPFIIPGVILLVGIILFFDKAATFHYTYIHDTTSFPGSGWDFLFGYSADGNQVVQANFVGILMLILMVIASVLVFLENSVKHHFVWTGIFLSISSVFMFAFPFLSLPSTHFIDVIEVTESYGIPVAITYSLGFPLILSGILLAADAVLAFLAESEETSKKRMASFSSKSQRRPNPKTRSTK